MGCRIGGVRDNYEFALYHPLFAVCTKTTATTPLLCALDGPSVDIKPHGMAQEVSFLTPPSIGRCRTKAVRIECVLRSATDLVPAAAAVIGQASGLSVAVSVVVKLKLPPPPWGPVTTKRFGKLFHVETEKGLGALCVPCFFDVCGHRSPSSFRINRSPSIETQSHRSTHRASACGLPPSPTPHDGQDFPAAQMRIGDQRPSTGAQYSHGDLAGGRLTPARLFR